MLTLSLHAAVIVALGTRQAVLPPPPEPAAVTIELAPSPAPEEKAQQASEEAPQIIEEDAPLIPQLQRAKADNADLIVQLQADADASYGAVAAILAEMEKAGIARLSLLTQK
ncbi:MULTISPECIES: ExbD/TolR family protein [Brenneria]|uniref:Biopolymer transporter ExbD n=1 Tax=Brenneria nigrifluens DSM 30175 = ATCC 13028 TaxID=1121120 RepID=A0A2U1UTM8_9GAMM|nr:MULTISPECIES: biopolymer transporter ExbD [Brenneria]EHD19719.1 Biopolymer transport protein ExbD/TolR [Brenneria sp. EniD312]PWC25016.1 hypothetical protein DDT54_06985 [Brenneria nigrifluens DSM 30175 = ATCC 13028]QCR02981.1 hypothetical protein EH206_01370 [Brenneria nigrifluens DSM 30175 = ATCC 13028]